MDFDDTIVTRQAPPSAIDSEVLREVARYWLSLRGERPWPSRGEIDPLDLKPRIWPSLWIVDCEDPEAGRFRFRLAGEAVNRSFGQVVRGCTLEDLFAPKARTPVARRFRQVADAGVACHCEGTVYVENEGSGWGERLILPLGEDASAVTHLFGVTVAEYRSLQPDEVSRPCVQESFFPLDVLPDLCA